MSRFSFFEDQIAAEQPAAEQNNSNASSGYTSPPLDEVRYRTEQLNVTRIEQRIVSHVDVKKEYVMQRFPGNRVNTTLVDYLYEIEPKRLAMALDAMKDLEYIKETARFRLNNDNEIDKVLNIIDMGDQWNAQRMQLKGTEFYKALLAQSPKAAEDILAAGDLEFKNEENMKITYDRNLMYHTLFNNFIDVNKKRTLNFLSQIFVNIPVEVVLSNKIQSQDDSTLTIHTKGEVNMAKLKSAEMEAQYDLYYKPLIKYGFTEYVYEYNIVRTIDKSTGNIIEARAVMGESIKNNYSTASEFNLKQVKL